MLAANAQAEVKSKPVVRRPRRISKERFLREYANRENGFKYEFNNGLVERTHALNQQQTTIYLFLLRIFCQTKAFKAGGGLTSETNMDTSLDQLRKPDIAYYSAIQVEKMKSGGENQVATWLAEIISPTDNADKINEKLEEYFRAGVQVIWHIFPASKQVYVYTSPETVTICRGKTVCSGAPALPDFQISAEELFS